MSAAVVAPPLPSVGVTYVASGRRRKVVSVQEASPGNWTVTYEALARDGMARYTVTLTKWTRLYGL